AAVPRTSGRDCRREGRQAAIDAAWVLQNSAGDESGPRISGHAEANDVQHVVHETQRHARRRTGLPGRRTPAAAAVHTLDALAGAGRIFRVGLAVILGVIVVPAVLRHVAQHVAQSPGIGLLLAYRMRRSTRVLGEPGVLAQIGGAVALWPLCRATGPTGVFPFRLGRQPIARAARHGHLLAIDAVIGLQAVALA